MIIFVAIRAILVVSESFPFYCGKGDTFKTYYPVNPWLETAKHDYVVGAFPPPPASAAF